MTVTLDIVTTAALLFVVATGLLVIFGVLKIINFAHGAFLTVGAYGALVTVRVGDKTYRRLINPASSYLCSNDARAHFGLGNADHVDDIEILWPDGKREHFEGRQAARAIVLCKGEGKR